MAIKINLDNGQNYLKTMNIIRPARYWTKQSKILRPNAQEKGGPFFVVTDLLNLP